MPPTYRIKGKLALVHARAEDFLPTLAADSFDAIVTDPPYGLEFMGKDWDRFSGSTSDRDFKGFVLAQQRTRNVKCPDCHKWAYDHPGRLCECGGVRRAQGSAFQQWCTQWAAEAFRVLKPGGHLVAFGGTRTYHRLACAIEDAGFEIRDSLHWITGTGFPKSLNVPKAIGKAAGAEREVIGTKLGRPGYSLVENTAGGRQAYGEFTDAEKECAVTAPATEDAARWAGYGTALKPAHEPIILARKPLAGTVVANVLAHGTGALNVDGCSTDTGRWPPNVIFTHAPACVPAGTRQVRNPSGSITGAEPSAVAKDVYAGRERVPWQAHGQDGAETIAAYDCAPGCPVAEVDAQSGDRRGFASQRDLQEGDKFSGVAYAAGLALPAGTREGFNDKGGASRFFPVLAWEDGDFVPFRYQAKAPKRERPVIEIDGKTHGHPTVKPVALMRWLIRLVAPPAEFSPVILDFFAGTGATGAAALAEGVRCVMAEQSDTDDAPYIRLACQRLGLELKDSPAA